MFDASKIRLQCYCQCMSPLHSVRHSQVAHSICTIRKSVYCVCVWSFICPNSQTQYILSLHHPFKICTVYLFRSCVLQKSINNNNEQIEENNKCFEVLYTLNRQLKFNLLQPKPKIKTNSTRTYSRLLTLSISFHHEYREIFYIESVIW